MDPGPGGWERTEHLMRLEKVDDEHFRVREVENTYTWRVHGNSAGRWGVKSTRRGYHIDERAKRGCPIAIHSMKEGRKEGRIRGHRQARKELGDTSPHGMYEQPCAYVEGRVSGVWEPSPPNHRR